MFIKLKTKDQIQWAHDLLYPLFRDNELSHLKSKVFDDEASANACNAVLDALCWVLDHDHAVTTMENLQLIREDLLKLGVKFPEMPAPVKTYAVIDTDNFGGDYPNESFWATGFTDKKAAEQLADRINGPKWAAERSSRHARVVDEPYELQPGFEP